MLKPYVFMNADLRKKAKILKNIFLTLQIMQFLEKIWIIWEKIDILNLSQLKEKGII